MSSNRVNIESRVASLKDEDSPDLEAMRTTAVSSAPCSVTAVITDAAAPPEPYSAFSHSQIQCIVTIACITGILSPLSANTYFPALGAIQADLKTTSELVNLSVTVYMIAQGLAPAFWGSLADVWGRRPVYLATILIYIASCVGLALTPVYWLLLVLRMLQAFGSSSVIAIGAGIVGDIAVPSRRGGYFGLFSVGQMLGPVIGPVLGGSIANSLSWRWIFWVLLAIGSFLVLLIFFFLPETLRSLVGNGSGYANPTPLQWIRRHRRKQQKSVDSDAVGNHTVPPPSCRRFLQIPNFTAPFRFLLEKDVAVALVYHGIPYAVYYCFLTSMSNLFSTLYELSELQIGLCFLAQGFGSITGSLVTGRILNYDFRKTAKEVGFIMTQEKSGTVPLDFPIYKARLRSVWIMAGLVQAVTLVYGWCIHVHVHLAIPLVLQCIVGFAVTSMFNMFQTLLVDLFHGKSASITATNNFVRCLLGAVATVSIEPGIQSVGVGWMFTILGLIMTASNVALPILWRYGPEWRRARSERTTREDGNDRNPEK